MWQIGLVGYTYMLAGHAAREGARELATDPTDDQQAQPVRDAAPARTCRRRGARARRSRCPGKKDDVRVRVRVELDVPVVIPGLKSGFTIASSADTSVETEELPPSQQLTPDADARG